MERQIECGQMEELVEQAESELELLEKMNSKSK